MATVWFKQKLGSRCWGSCRQASGPWRWNMWLSVVVHRSRFSQGDDSIMLLMASVPPRTCLIGEGGECHPKQRAPTRNDLMLRCFVSRTPKTQHTRSKHQTTAKHAMILHTLRVQVWATPTVQWKAESTFYRKRRRLRTHSG